MTKDLARVSIFQKLGEDDLKKIEKLAKRRKLAPATVVFFEGDRADAFYVVVSGSLKVYRSFRDGREKVLNTMGPGEIFGELAMLDGEPRSASVEAIEATELISIARNDFRAVATETPDILWKVLEALGGRLRALNETLVDAAFRDTPQRVTQAVVRLAEKHGEPTKEGLRIRAAFGTKALADMTATTPARVNRVLEKLEDDGLLLVVKDDLVVPDLGALKRALAYMGSE